ncbi:hypothetical protein FB451DRAFT_6981 [Mycena latifolia]|nr:hypothetical protein FB451DRAFT_6981 [Mycena latifolia]
MRTSLDAVKKCGRYATSTCSTLGSLVLVVVAVLSLQFLRCFALLFASHDETTDETIDGQLIPAHWMTIECHGGGGVRTL